MNYKTASRLSSILMVMGVVTSIFLYLFQEIDFWFVFVTVLALLFVAAGLLVKFAFYRCPHCRRLLPFKTMTMPKYCSYCGKELE